MSHNYDSKIIALAQQEIGYLEKASNIIRSGMTERR